jgi:hypothetical protein
MLVLFVFFLNLHFPTSTYLTICNVQIVTMTVQYNKMVAVITAAYYHIQNIFYTMLLLL